MLNRSNQFIVKLTNEHKTMIRDASTRRNPPPAQHPARPGANPLFTVVNAMFIFGINRPTLFQGDSQAKRISSKIFDYDFMSCMDRTIKKIDDDSKSYSTLTSANGQICLNPANHS